MTWGGVELFGFCPSNRYAAGEVRRVSHLKKPSQTDAEEECVIAGIGFLPYCKRVTDGILKLLERHAVKAVFRQDIENSAKAARD